MADEITTRGQLADAIVKQVEENADFKDALLADPRKVMSEELGMEIPSSTKVEVLQETKDTFYIVLPKGSSEGEELDDSDLEKVAGGALTKVKTIRCKNVSMVNINLR